MTDRVHPSTKPSTNGTIATAGAATAANGTTRSAPTKPSQLYRPYPPLKPPPNGHQHHGNRPLRRSRRRCTACCCCFWTILILLALSFLAITAGAALYVLYHPRRPAFSVSSLRTVTLNLTTTADASSHHLTTLFNLTLFSKNPNPHSFTFLYEPVQVTLLSSPSSVFLGNGSVPSFVSFPTNRTTFRAVASASGVDVDAESADSLRSDLRRKSGWVGLRVQMDTRVAVKVGGLKPSKKVGIRVTCDGIRGVVPANNKEMGGGPVANVGGSKCRVDLRVKIWRFTF